MKSITGNVGIPEFLHRLIIIIILNLYHMYNFQISRSAEAIKNFASKLEELNIWAQSSGLHFVDTHRDFGSNYESAKRFLQVHQELLNQVHMKCYELEGLKGALSTISSGASSNETTKEIQDLMHQLHSKLQKVKKLLDIRISIAEKYTKFHKIGIELGKEMDHLENQLSSSSVPNENHFEESRLLIQQLYLQVSNIGRNVMEDIQAMYDEFIDKSSTLECIQSIISKMDQKQSQIIELWKKMDSKFKEGKKLDEEWLAVVKDANEAVVTLKGVDSQLFPILKGAEKLNPSLVLNELEERMTKLPKLKVLPQRLSQMINNVEEVSQKLQGDKRNEGRKLVQELREEHAHLQVKL